MILFFSLFFLSYSVYYGYGFEDMSVGVWSGYHCVEKRMTAACNTWVHQFPEITVFSDKYPQGLIEKLTKLAYPTKINFVALGDCSQHFIATGWAKAQPRFLIAMERLYRTNTSKKWYFFMDDDSFPIAKTVMRIINQENATERKVIGHFLCVDNKYAWGYFSRKTDCLFYAKGGSGVIVSNAYFKIVADLLQGCNNKYTKRWHWASLRFAKCAYDHFPDQWNFGKIIADYPFNFFGRSPIEELHSGVVHDMPAVFHQMKKKEFYLLWSVVATEWKRLSDNKTVFLDWSDIVAASFPLWYGPRTQLYFYRFGLGIEVDINNGIIGVASSPLIPYFKESDVNHEKPYRLMQSIGDSIDIIMDCDDSVDFDDMLQDRFENSDKMRFYTRIKCPNVSTSWF